MCLLIKTHLYFTEKFTIFANITETSNGFPRLEYDGHTFGRRKLKSDEQLKYFDASTLRWACTKSKRNKRCTATVITRLIDGYVMMRVHNPHHICSKWVIAVTLTMLQGEIERDLIEPNDRKSLRARLLIMISFYAKLLSFRISMFSYIFSVTFKVNYYTQKPVGFFNKMEIPLFHKQFLFFFLRKIRRMKNPYYHLLMKFILYFSAEFTVFANITKAKNKFPRLHYENYTYGRRKRKNEKNPKYFETDIVDWVCTRNDKKNKRRCIARISTKSIDGYVMMRVKNPNHICTSWANDDNRKNETAWNQH